MLQQWPWNGVLTALGGLQLSSVAAGYRTEWKAQLASVLPVSGPQDSRAQTHTKKYLMAPRFIRAVCTAS